jgi:membrane protease YdiL (CAAX protease family)
MDHVAQETSSSATRYVRAGSAALLVPIGAVSVVLTTATNRAGGALLGHVVPSVSWLADACVPVLCASALLYALVRPARPLAAPLPNTNWSLIRRLGMWTLGIWLAGSALVAFHVGHWVTYTNGLASVIGFVLVAPLAEELLFRGAIFELAERAWPLNPAAPIWMSSVLFSLHHLDLHGFQLTRAALGQVAFTLPLGLAFAALRQRSGSLWPGLGLHVLVNLPGAYGARL